MLEQHTEFLLKKKISTDLTQKSELVINQKDFPTSSLIC